MSEKMPKNWEKVRLSKLSKDELINELKEENSILKRLNREYEERIEHLRVSRRVLMSLLEKVEQDKTLTIRSLERALDLERDTKRRLIRQNHPVRLALVKQPLTLEEHCKNIKPEEIFSENNLIERRDTKYYLENSREEVNQEILNETKKKRR